MSYSYDTIELIIRVLSLALVIVSASLHEFGHGYAAHLCGDGTAKEQGRLTINPLAHIDPVGSVLLPLLLVLSGSGFYMAFAKPVPYNPYRLRNQRRDDALVALAGPVANLLQALVGALVLRMLAYVVFGSSSFSFPMYIYVVFGESYGSTTVISWIMLILSLYVQVNCSLAFFNLLPIPPLDGSKLLIPFLKGEALSRYYQIQRYALPITMALIWLLPRYTGLDPIGWWLDLTAGNLSTLLVGW